MTNSDANAGAGSSNHASPGDIAPVLWAGRRAIVAGTLVCAAAAAIVAFLIPPEYEATATLVLLPPPFKEKEDAMSGLLPKVLSVRDYEILLQSDGVLMEVASELRTSGGRPQKELERLNRLSELRKCMSVDVTIAYKTAYGTTYSPVIELEARGPSPAFARDLAQTWAEVAVREASVFYRKGKTGLKAFVQNQLEAAQKELDRVNQLQCRNEAEWDETLAHERLAAKTTLRNRFEEDRIELQISLDSLKKENEQLRTELADEPRLLTLWKSPPMTAVFVEGRPPERAGAPATPEKGEGEGYLEESLNPTHLQLQGRLLDNQTKVAGLEEQLRKTNDAIEQLGAAVEAIRVENAQFALEKKRLAREASVYASSYTMLAQKLEQAKIAETEQKEELADLKIAADAVLPNEKVSPKRSLIVLSAAILGCFAACAAVVFRRNLARGQQ